MALRLRFRSRSSGAAGQATPKEAPSKPKKAKPASEPVAAIDNEWREWHNQREDQITPLPDYIIDPWQYQNENQLSHCLPSEWKMAAKALGHIHGRLKDEKLWSPRKFALTKDGQPCKAVSDAYRFSLYGSIVSMGITFESSGSAYAGFNRFNKGSIVAMCLYKRWCIRHEREEYDTFGDREDLLFGGHAEMLEALTEIMNEAHEGNPYKGPLPLLCSHSKQYLLNGGRMVKGVTSKIPKDLQWAAEKGGAKVRRHMRMPDGTLIMKDTGEDIRHEYIQTPEVRAWVQENMPEGVKLAKEKAQLSARIRKRRRGHVVEVVEEKPVSRRRRRRRRRQLGLFDD